MTNKQRQAFGLTHWKQHHGDEITAVDTECRISPISITHASSTSNCNQIRTRQPAKTIKKPIPIWISTSTAQQQCVQFLAVVIVISKMEVLFLMLPPRPQRRSLPTLSVFSSQWLQKQQQQPPTSDPTSTDQWMASAPYPSSEDRTPPSYFPIPPILGHHRQITPIQSPTQNHSHSTHHTSSSRHIIITHTLTTFKNSPISHEWYIHTWSQYHFHSPTNCHEWNICFPYQTIITTGHRPNIPHPQS